MTDDDAAETASSDHPHTVGHVHLKVRDLERALAFYREVLGLDVTEREGRYVFLSWGERHHDVALQEVGDGAEGPSRGVGLYHVAFEVATPEALASVYRRLRDRGVQVSPVDHGISKALYFADPDGNGVEVYLDTRGSHEETDWRGRNDRFDPTELV
ncbi:VOC family protein [Halosimplex sp. J119]